MASPMDPEVKVKTEATPATDLQARILAFCEELPQGVSDKLLQASMPDVNPADRAGAINTLLSQGKINLFKSGDRGLLYRISSESQGKGQQVLKGDAEEKLVYKIIEEAGNKGTWIRDIRIKSNLVQTQLNKVLKSLKSKKLIKDVKCVNSHRKIVFMLYNLEPDRSITGGAWYSDQDFESEFVDVLNQQCHRYLQQIQEKAKEKAGIVGPLGARDAAKANSKSILKYISELGISKVQLKPEDIEAILDTLVFDGKVEKSIGFNEQGEEVRYYRAIDSLVGTTGLMRVPCGACPVIKHCSGTSEGSVNPIKCVYFSEWLA